MGWVDEVPRSGGLYIGGLHALYQKQELFVEQKITHIVSVLDFEIYGPDKSKFQQYESLQIRIEDDPNENLLQHFAATNEFIEAAISKNGRVFIHCAMGKSRSATIVCAYLMRKFRITPSQALDQVCEGRPVCSPNPGFLEQLDVFHHMLQAETEDESQRIYDAWIRDRFIGDAWSWEKRREAVAKL